jgi:hypothetical protein
MQELLRTLSEPQNAVLKQFEALWAMQGVTLCISDEAQRAIAREAHLRGTGARSLRSLLEELLLDAQFEAAEQPGCSIVLEASGVLPPLINHYIFGGDCGRRIAAYATSSRSAIVEKHLHRWKQSCVRVKARVICVMFSCQGAAFVQTCFCADLQYVTLATSSFKASLMR